MRTRLLAALLLALVVTPLTAQDAAPANTRKSFWLGFGAGAGVNLSTGLDGESLTGGNVYLRFGGTPSQHLLLGAEGIAWVRDRDGVGLTRGNVQFVGMWYPSVTNGFYLKGGIGGAWISSETTSGNTTSETFKGGFGLGLGAGYEIKFGNNLYAVPSVDLLGQFFSEETDPVLGHIPGHNTLLLFNLGLLWH